MEILDLGKRDYESTWKLQQELVEKRARGEIADTLVFVEHPAVYTTGRAEQGDGSASTIPVPKLGDVPVVSVERGGRMTFHGPGQLVGYPIFLLADHDLRQYLKSIEKALTTVIADVCLLNTKPCPETLLLEPGQLQTGVWVQDRKLASIGIAVRKWVTYHGFALNVSTDLRYFEAIEPCGFRGSVITSIAKELGSPKADFALLTQKLKQALAEQFEKTSQAYSRAADSAVAATVS